MSNLRAIAAVTATLGELVGAAVDGLVPMAQSFNLQPGLAVANGDPGINVYLYRAVPNAGLRNLAEPVRRSDGQLIRRPVAAWDLHYLLTCIGDEAKLEPDLLLGAAVTVLNAGPLLPPEFIRAVEGVIGDDTRRGAVGSGLAEQVDVVRLTPLDLSLDTLSQLWSSLTSEPYAVSVAYQASAVLMSPELGIAASLPVAGQASAGAFAMRPPKITAVHGGAGPGEALRIDGRLVIEGLNLRSEHTIVRVGGLEIVPTLEQLGDTRIELPLSPDTGAGPMPMDLAPGVLGVQVRHRVDVAEDGEEPRLRPGPSSELAPVVLRPTLLGAPALSSDDEGRRVIVISTAPAPREEDETLLLLNERGVDEPEARVLARASIDDTGATPTLRFLADELPAGDWLVRVQVNGVDSPLEIVDGVFAEPHVEVEA